MCKNRKNTSFFVLSSRTANGLCIISGSVARLYYSNYNNRNDNAIIISLKSDIQVEVEK